MHVEHTWKRATAGVLSVLALLAGAVAVAYAIDAIGDFWNPAVPFRIAFLGELLMCSMAFGALALGMSLMRFSTRGDGGRGPGRLRAVLLGIGCFFPGFIFSFPLTMLWAEHTWPADRQSDLAAMEASCSVGIAAVIIGLAYLLRKRNAQKADL